MAGADIFGGVISGGGSWNPAVAAGMGGGALTPTGGLADSQSMLARSQGALSLAQTSATEAQTAMRKKILAQLLGMAPQVSQGQGGSFVGGADVGSLLQQLQGAGDGERATINNAFQNTGNTAVARLDARGLGSSNIVGSTMAGVQRQKQLALGGLNDRLINQRIGVQENGLNRGLQLQQILAGLLN